VPFAIISHIIFTDLSTVILIQAPKKKATQLVRVAPPAKDPNEALVDSATGTQMVQTLAAVTGALVANALI